MRHEPNVRLEQLRVAGPLNSNSGMFAGGQLQIIVSDGMGWDHVSVSRKDRPPTWAEMDQVKRLCFRDDEIVMQLHVTDGRKVNVHPNCLHLWRPQTLEEIAAVRGRWAAEGEAWTDGGLPPPGMIPLPPKECV